MARANHATLQRRARMAEILLAVILVGGAVLVGRLILAGPLFVNPVTIHVELPEVAGLHPHSDVSYRGQHVGTVTAVDLTSRGVRATLTLEGDIPIPRDSAFKIANLSAVGEQYIDIRPRTAGQPYLVEGDTVRLSGSALPTPTWQVLGDAQHLLRRVDTDDLHTIAQEVTTLFGQGDVNLAALATELENTIDMLERLSPRTLALVSDAERPLETMNDLAPDIRSLLKNSRELTDDLADSNETIDSLLKEGATLVPVVVDDFDSVTPALVKMLDDGTPVAAMARKHLPGLLHWYEWGPPQLVAMADGTRDNSGHVILVITAADNCRYGKEYSPYQKDVPLLVDAECTSDDPDVQQRGAQNVPRP